MTKSTLSYGGCIVAGTNPEYFGYSFSSGEQMGYFKPMLTDKKLSMCQDMVPNTAEGKMMMYAIVWNSSGTAMIQIGITPSRLLAKMNSASVENLGSADAVNLRNEYLSAKCHHRKNACNHAAGCIAL